MIIVSLKGGLGNQLFQYAAARQLAEIHGSLVKLDISVFETYEHHSYALSPFNIPEHIATAEEIAALTMHRRSVIERITTRLLRQPLRPTRTHVRERHFQFDPRILNLPDGVYLDGYWQSEKYFTGIADIIRKELTVRTPPACRNKELAEQMASCNSVSVHIRRGTYLLPQFSAYHPTCSSEYYRNAVEQLAASVGTPRFFIFSDEPAWAHENVRLPFPAVYVDHNDASTDYEDLRLMSTCRHHIIANSTFSWWAAWLNDKPGKIVLAPERWFNDPTINVSDLIPESWTKIRG